MSTPKSISKRRLPPLPPPPNLPLPPLPPVPYQKPPILILPIKPPTNLRPYPPSNPYSRSAVFPIDDDSVLKAQTQHPVPWHKVSQEEAFFLDLSHEAFLSRSHEREVLDLLRRRSRWPPNLARELDPGPGTEADQQQPISFFERLSPVTPQVWSGASKARRRRWALELTAAFAALEGAGLIPVRVNVRDLCVDRTARLKLVGYGTSTRWRDRGRRPSGAAAATAPAAEEKTAGPSRRGGGAAAATEPISRTAMQQHLDKAVHDANTAAAHSRLASCLHYLLTGSSPDDPVTHAQGPHHHQPARRRKTPLELASIRNALRRGDFAVSPDASPLRDVLRTAWSLDTADGGGRKSLARVAEEVRAALAGLEVEGEDRLAPALAEAHYRALGGRCKEWLARQEPEPRWMCRVGYEAACRRAGYHVE